MIIVLLQISRLNYCYYNQTIVHFCKVDFSFVIIWLVLFCLFLALIVKYLCVCVYVFMQNKEWCNCWPLKQLHHYPPSSAPLITHTIIEEPLKVMWKTTVGFQRRAVGVKNSMIWSLLHVMFVALSPLSHARALDLGESSLLIARLSDVYLIYIIRLSRKSPETRICMRFIQASALLQLQ